MGNLSITCLENKMKLNELSPCKGNFLYIKRPVVEI